MKPGAAILAICIIFLLGLPSFRAADTLPASLSDETFWRLVETLSEPDGPFRYENLLSNEISYQTVIPALKRIRQPTKAYVGVGPEQNFTYIAALEPAIAFIVDIRRENMLELLLYKALFETAADRTDFVSLLFSRTRPAGLDPTASARRLFDAYRSGSCDADLRMNTERRIETRLVSGHGFRLSSTDVAGIRHILGAFCEGGPQMDYGFGGAPSHIRPPSYEALMTATDGRGGTWSYLASETNFRRVREMQLNNLIIPVTGDFAGPKALRAIGAYLKWKNATVAAFYVSNVEQYLNREQSVRFRSNVSSLPVGSRSTLIRFIPPKRTELEPVKDFLYRRGGLFRRIEE